MTRLRLTTAKPIARAIRFEHRTHSPEVALVLLLTASHIRVARAKHASCLLHWLSMFMLSVPLFRCAPGHNRQYDYELFLFLNYIFFFYFRYLK